MSCFDELKILAKNAARILWRRIDICGKQVLQSSINAECVELVYRLIEADNEDFEVDLLNELYRRGNFSRQIYGALFSALVENGINLNGQIDENDRFLLQHAAAILKFFNGLCEKYVANTTLSLLPNVRVMLSGIDAPNPSAKELFNTINSYDPLKGGAVFRYDNGNFAAVNMENTLTKVDDFFGFHSVRRSYDEQFRDFANGKEVVPLLISSLPGHGKTQMTMAYTRHYENLTLILAPENALEKPFEKLVNELKRRGDRRFVLFFDDIDTNTLDWYYFRTHVGGAFSLPENVMLVIASNYHFPPSILSRGRSVAFPTFDDVRCLEMVEEFLAKFGFRHPNRNLISLISARYTEEFGQDRYTELSPRTLRRYLRLFETNIQKRKDMVQLSCGPMITKPDPQLFYEFNIALMRKLYGNEYIEALLKERLRNL